MDEFIIYCTEEQTKKALELSAPLKIIAYPEQNEKYIRTELYRLYKIPTSEQMIGWLKTKGFKFILSDAPDCGEGNNWWVGINEELITQGYNDNKELAAIDAALEYLSNNLIK